MQGTNKDYRLIPANGPCKGCTARELGCHSKCEEYIAFRAECDALAEERLKHRDVNNYIDDVMRRMPGIRNI